MTDAKYVLCRWKERLWPAKVLARTEILTKRKKEFFLNVQILSVDKKLSVNKLFYTIFLLMGYLVPPPPPKKGSPCRRAC